jgi:hypothetical protein
MMLLHSPLTIAQGNARDMRQAADELDTVGKVLASAVADKTGMSLDEVNKKWFDYNDHLMTSEEAKDAGLVDDILEVNGKVPQNISALSIQQVMNLYDSGFADESIIDRFASTVRNVFKEFSPKNLITDMKKKYLNLSKFLGTEIESVDGKLTLTDEVLDKIEAFIPTHETVAASLETTKAEKLAVITERDTATAALAIANEKVTALETEIAELRKKPGAQSATVKTETETGAEEVSAHDFKPGTPLAERIAILNAERKATK